MAGKSIKVHRTIRWFIQLLFLAYFLFILFRTRFGISPAMPNIFFRFDPLIFLIISIAYRTLLSMALLSLVVLVGSLVFGRFFCGYVCPLGTIIDLTDKCIPHVKQGNPRIHSLKYLTLLFLVVSSIIGVSFVHFSDPLVILERMLALVLYPIISRVVGTFTLIEPAYFTETLGAFLVVLMIIGFGVAARRFWCRYLCPLGGLLAFISKFSLLKFAFREGCTQCGVCEKVCPTSAIDYQSQTIDSAECIGCLHCVYECPEHSIEYRILHTVPHFDIERRQFISTVAAGVIAAPLSRSLLHPRLHERFIRPPGAIPESDFINICLHCGMCMKACPTNGLQPCVFEAGVNGLWTPRLIPRIGGCEKNCNLCGQVCPTSAIRRLSLEEKSYVRMGTAVIDRSRCIAWEQDKVCLICDEACPFNAITSLNETVRSVMLLRPFVDERICTGCGLCETRCPIEGPSAIQIYSIGEERKKSGSYITEEKVRLRACEGRPEDLPSGFIINK